MPNRPFVVSGCAFSRLDYTARLLTALGAPCGHEDVFHTAAFERGGTLFWPSNFAGDASWFAAPVIGKLPESSVVVHQVRHPLATVRDLVTSGFFATDTPERAFVEDFCPEARRGGALVRSLRFWLHWHQSLESAEDYDDLVYRRHRVEDLDAHTACETVALLGLVRNPSTAARVIESLGHVDAAAPKRSDGDPGEELTWDDVPAGKLRSEVRAAARRFGYSVGSSGDAAPPLHQVRQ